SLSGPARARVTDRAGWVRANVASFRRLLRPLTDRLGARLSTGPVGNVGRAVAGAEVGTLLGWMSTRVLGQYDLLIAEDDDPDEHAVLQRLQGLMSLLEGHGDVTMDRAGRAYVPSADRFARVLRQRRQASGLTKVVQKLTGIEAKLLQYEQGERFIEAVEREGGPELLETVWRGREVLPTP